MLFKISEYKRHQTSNPDLDTKKKLIRSNILEKFSDLKFGTHNVKFVLNFYKIDL